LSSHFQYVKNKKHRDVKGWHQSDMSMVQRLHRAAENSTNVEQITEMHAPFCKQSTFGEIMLQ
jgi:hypothetical protein